MRLGVLEQSSWLQLLTLAQSFGRLFATWVAESCPMAVECKATAAAATSSCSQLWTDCKGLEVAQQMGRKTFLLSLFLSKMRIVEIQPVEPKPSGMPVGDVWLAWRVCLSRMACPVSSYQWPQKVRFVDQHVWYMNWYERLRWHRNSVGLWHGTENLTGGHSGACHGLMLKAWPRSRWGLGCFQQAILSQLRGVYHERSVMLEPCLSSYQIHRAVHPMGNT